MSIDRPKYDPDDLAKYDLTEEEADGIRQGMLEIDRGETVDGAESFKRILDELEEMTRIRERRTG